ncbi:MAG TPA: hypothetical protein ENJ73_02160 [Desulfobacterales bacterium]|nr:hypothetical protein [Desulfobacterales bacterium]
MKLGILVNSDRHLSAIVGLTRTAVARGHSVQIFAMDSGTRLLEEAAYRDLAALDGVSMSYCDHSAKELEVNTTAVPENIECSSQFSNAAMHHNADKVLVL